MSWVAVVGATGAALFDTAMRAFPYVFHPTTVLGAGIITLIYYEWTRQPTDGSSLRWRVGAFLLTGVAALVPTVAFMLVTGQGIFETTKGNAWQVDWLVGWGVVLSAGATWLIWWRFDWGPLVPDGMEGLLANMVPYIALSPFWNVSGHVIIALFPTLYLTLLDRKFWPANVIPLVMIPNRLYLDAHTWAQVIGGFLIAAVITVLVFRLQRPGGERRTTRPLSH